MQPPRRRKPPDRSSARARWVAATAAGALLFAAAGCAPASNTVQGGQQSSDDATVLTLATAGGPDGRSAAQINEFARQVKDVSGGRLRIELVLKAAADEAGAWDQAVAQSTEGGDFDMALVPTRTWESEGVLSFAALSAPFLQASDQALAKMVEPEIAGSMMAGLKTVGLTGLALLPDGPRMLFAFGAPVATPAQLAGKVVRAPRSSTGYATLKALGATPETLAGQLFTDALAKGTVRAAESSFTRAAAFPRPSTTAGNLPLYVKVNSLVINSKTYTRLAADDRRILLEATAKTRAAVTGSMIHTAEEAAAYCQHGGTVVTATDKQVAAFEAAAAPVYAQLEKDATTRALIARIRTLSDAAGGAADIAPCGPGAGPGG